MAIVMVLQSVMLTYVSHGYLLVNYRKVAYTDPL